MSDNKDLFLSWWSWQLRYKDLDPALWMINYINDRYEHTVEERLWLAWLYGNTYYAPTAWIIKNEFPDFRCVDINRLTNWNNENYKRLRYQTDTKWSKGHLPRMFQSYKEWVGNRTQLAAHLDTVKAQNDTPFGVMSRTIKKDWYKFGRYSMWFYLQTVHKTCNTGINYEPETLLLSDYFGSKSHRNGLIYVLGTDYKSWLNTKLSPDQYEYLENQAEHLLLEMRTRGYDTDYFDMETSLCAFKKIFRISRGRYLGYYLDRQSEEIKKVQQDGWTGIDWSVLWQARNESLYAELAKPSKVDKEMMKTFVNTQSLDRINWNYA